MILNRVKTTNRKSRINLGNTLEVEEEEEDEDEAIEADFRNQEAIQAVEVEVGMTTMNRKDTK